MPPGVNVGTSTGPGWYTSGMAADEGTTVEASTTLGTVRGTWQRGVARFAGIPFAAPPVGDLRFRPPAPAEPWDGVRPAEQFGPVAPQNPSLMEALFGGEAEQWGEDCLYLNVWTPEPEPDEPLAVMVWIHGGGFEMGSGSSPLYDGTSFAQDGVVLVTLNYRLGAFGFLELGEVDPSRAGSGNVGLLDQVAALEWVRDNISSFGGDPSRVTIFGESAGAMSVSLLMSMPRATGLFHRVIAQSGAASVARTPALAAADTAEFMADTGLTSIEELLAAEPAAAARRARSDGRDPDRRPRGRHRAHRQPVGVPVVPARRGRPRGARRPARRGRRGRGRRGAAAHRDQQRGMEALRHDEPAARRRGRRCANAPHWS